MAASADAQSTTLYIDNMHCPSCVTSIRELLRTVAGVQTVDVSLMSHAVQVHHDGGFAQLITNILIDNAWEVTHLTVKESSGKVVEDMDVFKSARRVEHIRLPLFPSRARRQHVRQCAACQKQQQSRNRFSQFFKRRKLGHKSSEDLEAGPLDDVQLVTGADGAQDEKRSADDQDFTATISVSGMTCASCAKSISDQVTQLEFVNSIEVNVLGNRARVEFCPPENNIERIIEAIEDAGFEASIDEVDSISKAHKSIVRKATVGIEGMTCGSCVNSIESGLKHIDGVVSVHVDLLGNSAAVRFKEPLTTEKICEEIDDLGFEASLTGVEKESNDSFTSTQERMVEFEITGMYCPDCPRRVSKSIRDTFGHRVNVITETSLKSPRLKVQYKPLVPDVTVRSIKAAIETADPAIAASVSHAPSPEERSNQIHHKESMKILRHLIFSFIAAVPSFIIGIIYMSLVPADNPTRMYFNTPIWSGNAMRDEWAMFILTTPVMFYGAGIFHTRALREIWSIWRLKSKMPILKRFYRFGSMNLLISAGTSVAYFSSFAILMMEAASPPAAASARQSTTYFDTVTFLTFFILIGKFLQAYSKARTGDAVAMLGKLRPTHASLIDSGNDGSKSQKDIPIELLEVGDMVSVPYGTSPPVDGIVMQEGIFLFDESSLTGEARPVRKQKGDKILTGSVNQSDPCRIQVSQLGGTSMLDQIIAVVREGQAKRAPVERIADLLTSYFTPVITYIAILTWLVWLVLGYSGALPRSWLDVQQGGWAFWSVEFAIAVFVVACPCGLGLAAPTALFVGGGLAARAGILVQGGGEAFQEASRVDAIVFDKTGTLTEGQMQVTDFSIFAEDKDEIVDKDFLLQTTRLLEEVSTHPIAKAIVEYCQANKQRDESHLEVSDLREVSGQGMRGMFRVSDKSYEVLVGNERLLKTFTIDSDTEKTIVTEENTFLSSMLHEFQSRGCSIAVVAAKTPDSSNFKPFAFFAITDPIKSAAKSVLNSIRSKGIEVHMCTGDNQTTALAIASQLDIPVSQVRAGVLPQDKAAYIQELQHDSDEKRRIIAFVGDGTNDTPALTAADVSIALASGSDIALTSASFILLNNDLTTILNLLRLAKRVFLRVKINFVWAAIYNIALIPVAAGVFFPIHQWRLSPVWASAAMAGSSISVVLSSLALRLPEIKMSALRK